MKNLPKVPRVHESLEESNYWVSRSVGIGAKNNRICNFCSEIITKGTPHRVHYFYPEFDAYYPTHVGCEKSFLESLQTEENKKYLKFQHLVYGE